MNRIKKIVMLFFIGITSYLSLKYHNSIEDFSVLVKEISSFEYSGIYGESLMLLILINNIKVLFILLLNLIFNIALFKNFFEKHMKRKFSFSFNMKRLFVIVFILLLFFLLIRYPVRFLYICYMYQGDLDFYSVVIT
jgi:hypothetical protein